jgi:hypothetical protein
LSLFMYLYTEENFINLLLKFLSFWFTKRSNWRCGKREGHIKYYVETLYLDSINLCWIWGSRSCDYEGYCFLECDGVQSKIQQRFGGTYYLHLHGEWVREASKNKEEGERGPFGLLLEDGRSVFLRNVCELLQDCTASRL